MLKYLKFLARRRVMVGEDICFLTAYLPFIWVTMTANLKMIDFDFVSHLHTHNALYSATLLEHDSVNEKECGIMCPSGVMNIIIPTPEVNSSLELVRVAPSKYISHLSRGCPGKVKMWKTGSSGRSSFRLESGTDVRQGNLLALVLLQLFVAHTPYVSQIGTDNRMDHLASLALSDPALATKIFSGFTREIRLGKPYAPTSSSGRRT